MSETVEREIRLLRAHFWSKRDPDGRAFAPLADAYLRKGDLEEARTLLEDGLGRHPDFASAHLVNARVCRAAGEEAGALASVDRLLELDPGNASGHLLRGELLEATGDAEGAAEAFRQALSLEREFEDLEGRIARLSGGVPAETGEEAAAPETGAFPGLEDAERHLFDEPGGRFDPDPSADEFDLDPSAEDFGLGPSDDFDLDPASDVLDVGGFLDDPHLGAPPEEAVTETGLEAAPDDARPGTGVDGDRDEPRDEPREEPRLDAPPDGSPSAADAAGDEGREAGEWEGDPLDVGFPDLEFSVDDVPANDPAATTSIPGPEQGPGGSGEEPPEQDAATYTRTLGELYARQGLVGQAVAVYERLLRRDPHNQELAARLQELREGLTAASQEEGVGGAAPAAGEAPAGTEEPAGPEARAEADDDASGTAPQWAGSGDDAPVTTPFAWDPAGEDDEGEAAHPASSGRSIHAFFEDLHAWVPGAVPIETLAPDRTEGEPEASRAAESDVPGEASSESERPDGGPSPSAEDGGAAEGGLGDLRNWLRDLDR